MVGKAPKEGLFFHFSACYRSKVYYGNLHLFVHKKQVECPICLYMSTEHLYVTDA
jgi:hypothetical protein